MRLKYRRLQHVNNHTNLCTNPVIVFKTVSFALKSHNYLKWPNVATNCRAKILPGTCQLQFNAIAALC